MVNDVLKNYGIDFEDFSGKIMRTDNNCES